MLFSKLPSPRQSDSRPSHFANKLSGTAPPIALIYSAADANGRRNRTGAAADQHVRGRAPLQYHAQPGPSPKARRKNVPQLARLAQDLQFHARTPTIRYRNRPAKQVGGQRWLNLHSTNRGSTRSSVLCAVSASPECLRNRGELHRLRTGSPAHRSRPRGPGSTSRSARRNSCAWQPNPLF